MDFSCEIIKKLSLRLIVLLFASLGCAPSAYASLTPDQCGAAFRRIANQTYTSNGNFTAESNLYYARVNAFNSQYPECRDGNRQPSYRNPSSRPGSTTSDERRELECLSQYRRV
jgi:hypothetical protein